LYFLKITPTISKAQFKSPTNPQGGHSGCDHRNAGLLDWAGLSFAAPLEPAHCTPPNSSVLTLPLPRLQQSKAPALIPPPYLSHLFSLLIYPPCPLPSRKLNRISLSSRSIARISLLIATSWRYQFLMALVLRSVLS
jgi:hypothetical protein